MKSAKLMAIDYGGKRVGIASTDESGKFALPRLVLPNDETLLEKILDFKEKESIEKIIIGESRNLDGSPNLILKDIETFKKALEEKGIEVIFHPEIFTTMEARQIQGNTDMTDASAAALILKNYIDTVYN
ncbi:MAG: RuvX/YqgF family protein [Patescibacteria group bacterium]